MYFTDNRQLNPSSNAAELRAFSIERQNGKVKLNKDETIPANWEKKQQLFSHICLNSVSCTADSSQKNIYWHHIVTFRTPEGQVKSPCLHFKKQVLW